MKKALSFFLPPIIIAVAIFFGFQYFVLRPSEKGALQVTTSPESAVYLNGRYVGQTPLCKCPNTNSSGKQSTQDLLQAGDYTIKLVPTEKSLPTYTDTITIRKSLLTVVDRKFQEGARSDGSIISLAPMTDKTRNELLVVTIPDKTEVFVDDSRAGTSPLVIKDLTPAKHDLRLRKDRYSDKVIPLLSTNGYRLSVTAYLGVDDSAPSPTPVASPSGLVTPTPAIQQVTILSTPTGFLRVREDASVGASEIARVVPGDKLPLLDELDGWYKVHLPSGKEGWVSSQYATKE